MKPVIEIKGISKKYDISHLRKTNYRTVREDLSALLRRPTSLVSGKVRKKEEFWALRDVSFDVNQGDIVGIIGRNGSGKSTLLKILSRIVDPTRGEAILHGKTASLLEVGTGFHAELTGRENVYFNGSILGMKRSEINAKFNDIVEFAGVEKFLDTPVKFYSSGMYVRLAFAVAAHLDPEILIVDEVLAVGDAEFQKKSLGKMSSVARDGRTVLFVSHSMPTVQKLCNKGVHLVDGQVAKIGTMKQAVDSYINSHLKTRPLFDLPLPPRPKELAGYATSVAIFDSQNHPASSIVFGQDFTIKIAFKINRPLENFVIAAGFKNSMDVAVRTIWSKGRPIQPGSYTAGFRFNDVMLETGLYNIELGLSEKEMPFDNSEGQAFFNIEPSATHDPRILKLSGSGIVLNTEDVMIERS